MELFPKKLFGSEIPMPHLSMRSKNHSSLVQSSAHVFAPRTISSMNDLIWLNCCSLSMTTSWNESCFETGAASIRLWLHEPPQSVVHHSLVQLWSVFKTLWHPQPFKMAEWAGECADQPSSFSHADSPETHLQHLLSSTTGKPRSWSAFH